MIATSERMNVAPKTNVAIPRYCFAAFAIALSPPGHRPRISMAITNRPITSRNSFAMKTAPASTKFTRKETPDAPAYRTAIADAVPLTLPCKFSRKS